MLWPPNQPIINVDTTERPDRKGVESAEEDEGDVEGESVIKGTGNDDKDAKETPVEKSEGDKKDVAAVLAGDNDEDEEGSAIVGDPQPKENKRLESAVSERSSAFVEVEAVRAYFESSASQLTTYGLCELHSSVNERQLGVFFRNNHFNTIFKYGGELFLLVTDQGFIDERDLVWEKLSTVDGDTQYMNSSFTKYMPQGLSQMTIKEQAVEAAALLAAAATPSSPDAQVNVPADLQGPQRVDPHDDADLVLAMQLQEQELAAAERQQHPQQRQRR